MAKQSTKKAKEAEAENAVKEEVNLVNEEVKAESPVEQPVEEDTTVNEEVPVNADEQQMEETPANEDKDKPVEEPVEEEIPIEESDNDIDEPVSADEGLSNEKILEIAEALNEAKKVQGINELTPNTATVLKSEISKLENLEEELRKDIELKESVLSEENKGAADKLFRRGFTEFWNGVSDGWNN